MIPRRYVWLLRDETTLFESVGPRGGTWCKLCSALERPGGLVPRSEQARHLVAHRHEKITNDPEAATIAAATERI